MNRRHLAAHGGDDVLAARIRSYELAARMQLSVPLVTDLQDETRRDAARSTASIGPKPTDFGRACLLARRLLERGVRFVQLFSGGTFGSPGATGTGTRTWWRTTAKRPCGSTGRSPACSATFAAAACSTTRWCCSRPSSAARRSPSRRPTWSARDATTTSMASASGSPAPDSKHGIAYGATDEIGWNAAEQIVTWHDFHATVLHLLGIDHKRLTYYHNGIRRRLTNVHGHVVTQILSSKGGFDARGVGVGPG